jgi:hypothetical protein
VGVGKIHLSKFYDVIQKRGFGYISLSAPIILVCCFRTRYVA